MIGLLLLLLLLWHVDEVLSEAPVFGYYNIYLARVAGRYDHALSVVNEQIGVLRASGLLARTAMLYVKAICDQSDCPALVGFNEPNVRISTKSTGSEVDSLGPLWRRALELRDSDALFYYIHSKGTYTVRHENTLLRRGLMNTVVHNWRRCFAVLAGRDGTTCGMRFSVLPHAHFPGNMWWARADYVATLVAPTTFEARFEFDPSDCQVWSVGRERCGFEHWVGSAPQNRPFDCLSEKSRYIHSYFNLNELESAECAAAPRNGTFGTALGPLVLQCFATLRDACLQAEREAVRLYMRQYTETKGLAGSIGNFVSRCVENRIEN